MKNHISLPTEKFVDFYFFHSFKVWIKLLSDLVVQLQYSKKLITNYKKKSYFLNLNQISSMHPLKSSKYLLVCVCLWEEETLFGWFLSFLSLFLLLLQCFNWSVFCTTKKSDPTSSYINCASEESNSFNYPKHCANTKKNKFRILTNSWNKLFQ